ncbi:helix-turn-helix domain-containing protein [Paenibacillus sp. HJL G12]|uniref:Helix-turn-helix domain-containing protein n=1 Tax=Paenibacillus dendrobii TaxID=2691084 RepID=A0A7X3LHR5_9BACL|nr:AraC family transcriptional regulator [Paenibacillus dendrobii]MWV44450.1 helix-turn-helix domain-containing protein [Paenibacillus dendrobii]
MLERAVEYYHVTHFNPDEYDKNGGLWTIHAGMNEAKPDYHAGPRMVPYYSLHFVKSGAVELSDGQQTVILNKGDVFCLFPERTYTYRIYKHPDELRMGWVAFQGMQADSILSSIPLSPSLPYVRQKVTREFLLAYEQLLHAGTGSSMHDRLNRSIMLYRLLSQLLPAELEIGIPTRPDQWIEDSKNYMDTHYTEDITVQHAAEYVGVHRSYFSKMFTERVGTTPTQYLKRLKMDKALLMLKQGHSVLETALSLGYSDTASFSRAFHRYFGSAPTRYYKSEPH